MFLIRDLAPMILPDDCGWRRDALATPSEQGDDFAERYDWTTLAYGAAWTGRHTVLVTPKLLNLARLIRNGRFESDAGDHPLRRIRRFRRHDEVELDGGQPGPELRFSAAGIRLHCPVTAPWATGRRVLVTISRDNDLQWVFDWASHHVRTQGADAVVILDNASTAYKPDELLDCLRGVPGLTAGMVVTVSCRYGPLLKRGARGKAKFLQGGLLNLARHGWLRDARSVLVCDIDEIAVSAPAAPTLFEAAERSWLGYATAPAFWRGAAVSGRLPRHGDHVLAWRPERQSKEKWCVAPLGRLGGFSWDVHGVGRYQFNRIARAEGIRFLHCEAISTDWKRPRRDSAVRGAHFDAETASALQRAGLRDAREGPASAASGQPT